MLRLLLRLLLLLLLLPLLLLLLLLLLLRLLLLLLSQRDGGDPSGGRWLGRAGGSPDAYPQWRANPVVRPP